MIKEYDKVKTLVEKNGYPAGTNGIVVSLYTSGPACEVELWDDENYPVDAKGISQHRTLTVSTTISISDIRM